MLQNISAKCILKTLILCFLIEFNPCFGQDSTLQVKFLIDSITLDKDYINLGKPKIEYLEGQLTNLTSKPLFSTSDSLKVIQTAQTLFSAIKTNDLEYLKDISTDKIYCIICFDSSDFSESPYMIEKKDFLENHLHKIKNSESFKRVTKSEKLILFNESGHRSDITVHWTIYRQDELAPGHEGEQFGVYFKRVGDEFKFAGMEMIP